jgi:hypothetical protein
MVCTHIFFQKCYYIHFVIWNYIFLKLCFYIRCIKWIVVTKDTTHDLKNCTINIFIIINTKKNPHNAFLLWGLHLILWTYNFW